MVKKMSEEKNVIKDYIKTSLNDSGYNRIFYEAKSFMENDTSPSVYLISYFFVVDYLESIGKTISDNQIQRILKKCREVNKLDLGIKYNGTWDKVKFFDFIEDIIRNIDNQDFKAIDASEIKNFKANMFNIYLQTISSKTIIKKAVYPLFEDVVGLEKAKRTVRERIIEPSLHKEIYKKYDVQVGGGMLLFGLPGTGKTMFAQAVANEIDGYFINVKSSDVKSKYYGDTEQRIRNIFDEASKHKVAVIFFDEFEAIGVSRDKYGSEVTAASVVPELLNQLQGFQKRDNIVLVIAATNRPWDIDSALLRPGRLDTLVYVDLPNKEARELMFHKYLSKINVEEDIIEYLANYTNGYNGSDIKEISDQLIRIVINKEIAEVDHYSIMFEDCVDVLKDKKSSVSSRDISNMNMFINNHKLTN